MSRVKFKLAPFNSSGDDHAVSINAWTTGPYLAGGAGGAVAPLGKLNVDFFNEVFVFDGIFLRSSHIGPKSQKNGLID